MNTAETIIMDLLASQRRWWFGLELIQASKLSRVTVYEGLRRLEAAGAVVSEEVEEDRSFRGGHARRRYKTTESGLRALASLDAPGNSLGSAPA